MIIFSILKNNSEDLATAAVVGPLFHFVIFFVALDKEDRQ